MTYTLDEIRTEFLCEITDEARDDLADTFREKCDFAEAAELVCTVMQNMRDAAEANKEAAAALDKMNIGDKLLFLIREAYTVGAIEAFEIAAQTNAAGMASVERKGGETMTPNEKRSLTYQRKRDAKAERKAEREAQVKALREIRDDPNATPADRLRAVELLKEYHAA